MKPYSTIPIKECGEPLLPIPVDKFAFFEPHPYVAQGAPYGNASPWMLRQSIIEGITRAQANLQKVRPGWKILFFDAYRPHQVQAYMVELEFKTQAKLAGLDYATLTPQQREALSEKVYRIFAIPNDNPLHPPPHSTGAVMDITFADENGKEVDMGSPIDENSDRSNPDYFKDAPELHLKKAHENRELLYNLMRAEGFHRHWTEWWHFGRGDQIWALIERTTNPANPSAPAIYGRADLLPTG